MPLLLFQHQNIDILAKKMLKSAFDKKEGLFENKVVFACESRGMQKRLKMQCAREQGIFMGFEFSDLTSILLKCAFAITGKYEKRRKFDGENLLWMLYLLLNDMLKNNDGELENLIAYCKNKDNGDLRCLSLAKEIAANFTSYQIYRPEMIEKWNKNEKAQKPSNADFIWEENERWQRYVWHKLKKEYAKGENDIAELYGEMQEKLKGKIVCENLPKKILVFAPIAIQPIYLEILSLLRNAGCDVELYYRAVSVEYIGLSNSDKQLAKIRKLAMENGSVYENNLYWDIGNRLIANLGKTAQNFYEQLLEKNIDIIPLDETEKTDSTLLEKIQADIILDSSEMHKTEPDNSIQLHSCHSPLREIEVLHDSILQMLEDDKDLKLGDILVLAPDTEKYASAIEMAFSKLKYTIADRDIKKSSSVAQLLNMLFSAIGGRYEAQDIVSLFFYSQFVQEKEIEKGSQGKIKKWINENAIRYGLKGNSDAPNYSWETGIEQLAAGYLTKSDNLIPRYCYPEIEGQDGKILGDLAQFINALKEFENCSKERLNIAEWDKLFSDLFPVFFGEDSKDFSDEEDSPIYQIIKLWDTLKEEMKCGFGENYFENAKIPFVTIKFALLDKMNENSRGGSLLNGAITFAKFSSLLSIPAKVICCIGMNDKEFPNQAKKNEMNLLLGWNRLGDKDVANEDRAGFLEAICGAEKILYISYLGQSEEDNSELNPSSVVLTFLKNLREQYKIDTQKLIIKHPLQPFSENFSYDSRWCGEKARDEKSERNIFKWEIIKNGDGENSEEMDARKIYGILSDAPKYFLQKSCNIELPQDVENLENAEKFVIEDGLEEWKIKDLAIKRIAEKKEIENEIKILQIRGELPTGNYAERLIKEKIDEANEMIKGYENCEWQKCDFDYYINADIPTFIKPSRDKGKYRLWHYLAHLDFNLKHKETKTRIILIEPKSDKKFIQLYLQKISKKDAEAEIKRLQELAQALQTKMLPIFPDAAWVYLTTKNINSAWEKINIYDTYAERIFGKAESLHDLGIEKEFIEYSGILFGNYKKISEEK